MPDSKISGLTSATTPLAGTEVLPIVQGGQTRQVSVANLTAGRSVDASTLTVTGNTYLATTSGNVGVGTTSPTNKLHIVGSGDILRFTNGTVSLYGYSDSAGLGWFTGTVGTNVGVYYNNTSSYQSFYTSSTERMRIDTSGNVGIGTSSPSYKLDVVGEVRANNLFRTTDGTNIGLFGSSVFAANVIGVGSSNSAPLVLGTAAIERLRITAAGDVGIGTSSPSGKFDVVGAVGAISINGNGNLLGFSTAGQNYIYASSAGGFFTFNVNGGSEAMRITSTGDVGIGTSSPSYKLDIRGSAVGSNFAAISVDNTAAGSGSPANTVSINFSNGGAVKDSITGAVYGDGYLAFATNNNTEKMRITAAGDVGIGTSSPGYRLDVYKAGAACVSAARSDTQALFRAEVGSCVTDLNVISTYGEVRTATNHPLLFSTNLTERMRITATGDVGIGTSSPNARLEANAAITFIDIDTFGQFVVKAAAGATGYLLNFGVDPTNTHSFIQSVNRGTDTAPLVLQRYGGNVGIGTTSPSAKLDVASAGSVIVRVQNTTTSADAYFQAQNTVATGLFGVNATGQYMYTAQSVPTLFYNAGAERMRIDSSGNVGVGVTPSAWSGGGQLQLSNGNTVTFSGNTGTLGTNGYYNAGWKYITSSYAAQYLQINGQHQWFTAPSGTAGNAISFTQAMTLDANGNLGVGTTSPDIFGRFYTRSIGFSSSGTTALQINGTTYGTIDLGAGGTRTTSLTGSGTEAQFATVTSIPLIFGTNNTERMRIDSAGNVGIGTSSPSDRLTVQGSIAYNLNGTTDVFKFFTGGAGLVYAGTTTSTAIAFITNGAEKARLDTAGNLGLGVTPSAWNSTSKAIQISIFASVSQQANGAANFGFNFYESGANSFTYSTTDEACRFSALTTGGFGWFTAPSGTAGTAITFTQAMTLDASGNLLVGQTSSISGKLQVSGAGGMRVNEDGAGTKVVFLRSDFAGLGPSIQVSTADPLLFLTSNTERMRITAAGNVGIGTNSPVNTAGYGGLTLNGTSGAIVSMMENGTETFRLTNATGYSFVNTTGSTPLLFGTAATERMRLDASGNLLVGTTSASAWSTASRGLIEVNGSSSALIGLKTGNTQRGYMYTQGTDLIVLANTGALALSAETGSGIITLSTAGSERARIDSSGNLLVGSTSGPYSTANRGYINISGSTDSVLGLSNGASARGYLQGTATAVTLGATTGSSITFDINGEKARITSAGNIHTPAGATTMTNGFIYIPSAGGVPTGAATAITGTVPLYYNSSSNTLYAYNSGWQTISGGLSLLSTNANGVVYLNGSSQATTSANLTFDDSYGGFAVNSGLVYSSNITTTGSSLFSAYTAIGYATVIRQYGSAATGTTDGVSNAGLGVLDFSNSAPGLVRTSAAYPLVFATNGTERMRITSAGELGIGTSTPSQKLHVNGGNIYVSNSVAGNAFCLIYNSNAAAGSYAGFGLWNDNGFSVNSATINFYSSGSTTPNELRIIQGANAPMTFYTNNTERMRITAGGEFVVGATATVNSSRVYIKGTGTSSAAYAILVVDSAGDALFGARNDGAFSTGVASLSPYNRTTASAANVFVDSSGFLFRSTSSARYKTDIQNATHGLAELLTLRPVTFKSKGGDDTVYAGLIAEEVHEAGLTEFVEYNANGEPDAVYYSNMVSLLTKAIQEQQAIIQSLTARIAALESAN